MNCCTNVLILNDAGTCENSVVDFQTNAAVDGAYKMVFDFLGAQFSVEKTFAQGEQLTFPTEALNENYTFIARIYEPEGAQVVISRNGKNYDCFQFKTKVSIAL